MMITKAVQVVAHQVKVGAKGLTAVFGPPAHQQPPFFRPSGMDSRWVGISHTVHVHIVHCTLYTAPFSLPNDVDIINLVRECAVSFFTTHY
jgi:hypothetical protein